MAFRMNAVGSAALSVLCIEFQVEDFEYKILEISCHVGLLCESLTRIIALDRAKRMLVASHHKLFFAYMRGAPRFPAI
jgi:hypothetical protein